MLSIVGARPAGHTPQLVCVTPYDGMADYKMTWQYVLAEKPLSETPLTPGTTDSHTLREHLPPGLPTTGPDLPS